MSWSPIQEVFACVMASPVSSSRFKVSDLLSLTDFELIFCTGERYGSSFCLLQVDLQLSQHSSPGGDCIFCSISGFVQSSTAVAAYLSCSLSLHVCFCTNTVLLHYCDFAAHLKSDTVMPAPASVCSGLLCCSRFVVSI